MVSILKSFHVRTPTHHAVPLANFVLTSSMADARLAFEKHIRVLLLGNRFSVMRVSL